MKLKSGTLNATPEISVWRGLNDRADELNRLESGELHDMNNFRVTDGGTLRQRPGTRRVAGLANGWTLVPGSEELILREYGTSTLSVTANSIASVDGVGVVTRGGTSATLTADTASALTGYYYGGTQTVIYRHTRLVITRSGSAYGAGGDSARREAVNAAICDIGGGAADGTEDNSGNNDTVYSWYGVPCVSTYPGLTDASVQALWSGWAAGEEVILAACTGHLYRLRCTDTHGASGWEKTDLGAIAVNAPFVNLFGFEGYVYCIDGSEIRRWDGTTFSIVSGYIPTVAVACSPSTGGGTELEQVNRLTNQKRRRYSPDGTSTLYSLATAPVLAVESVTRDGTEIPSTDYTVNATAGTVTFNTAPAAGTDCLTITYRSGTSARSSVTAMRGCELFNGSTDNRVFLYGDGSARMFYSGIRASDGKPGADYFPELNVLEVGEANAPLTGLIKQYSRLLAFKADSAYIIRYGELTDSEENVIAGFYCNPLNRSIGCAALGQTVLAENRPRTVDGRSIYEWRGTGSGGTVTTEQRAAVRISAPVENTLAALTSPCRCFYDKLRHEYYAASGRTLLVQNAATEAWYRYEMPQNCEPKCFISCRGSLFMGTAAGWLVRMSDDYNTDDDGPFTCMAETGALDFGRMGEQKTLPEVEILTADPPRCAFSLGLRPDSGAYTETAVETTGPADGAERLRVHRIHLHLSRFITMRVRIRAEAANRTASDLLIIGKMLFSVRCVAPIKPHTAGSAFLRSRTTANRQ